MRPDKCPECGSLDATALMADGTRYNPFAKNAIRLWDRFRCEDCGKEWKFQFIQQYPEVKDVA